VLVIYRFVWDSVIVYLSRKAFNSNIKVGRLIAVREALVSGHDGKRGKDGRFLDIGGT